MNSKSRPDDPRNNLLFEYLRLVDELEAWCFVMENVPPLLTEKRYGELWARFVEQANDYGFDVANVVDAVNYGVPQYRRQAIVMGSRAGTRLPQLPMPTHWCYVAEAL